MKKIIYILLFFQLTGWSVSAQQIQRSVLCSIGSVQNSTLVRLSSTFGQCPGCTVLSSPNVLLRQGFQQPVRNPSSPDIPCGLMVNFDYFEDDAGVCGKYYSFEYTGTVDPDLSYEWSFGEGAIPQSSTDANPSHIAYTSVGPKLVTVVVSKPGCSESGSRIVVATGIGFAANPVSSDVLCYGDRTGSIQLQVFGGTAPLMFDWSNNVTIDHVTDLATGTYQYSVTDANGCTAQGNVIIDGPTDPLTVLGHKTDEFCAGTEDGAIDLTVSGGTIPYTFDWSDGKSDEDRNGLVKGNYAVTVSDNNGCFDTLSFYLFQICTDGSDIIPDVFTPNGDGMNDHWLPFPGDKISSLELFNRWGESIYSIKDPGAGWIGWDGKNNSGSEMPLGAYYYSIKLNDAAKTSYTGSITLVR